MVGPRWYIITVIFTIKRTELQTFHFVCEYNWINFSSISLWLLRIFSEIFVNFLLLLFPLSTLLTNCRHITSSIKVDATTPISAYKSMIKIYLLFWNSYLKILSFWLIIFFWISIHFKNIKTIERKHDALRLWRD